MKFKTVVFIFAAVLVSGGAVTAQERADALVEYKNGNLDKAIEICLSEIERMPRNLDSYVVLGWSYIKKGQYQAALDAGLAGLDISRYDARIIEITGEANFYLGKNLDALKYFEEYAALAPTGDRIELAYRNNFV